MSDYFDLLEAELRAAVPRVAPAPRRRRAPLGMLVPALGLAVALAVAGAAVLLLHHARRPVATPAAPQRAAPSGGYPTPAQLLANFGVLRRAQTAADRSWPGAARASGPLVAGDTREAVRLGNRTRIFLTVSRDQGPRGESSGRVALMIWIVQPDGDAFGTSFGANVNYDVFPLSTERPRNAPTQGARVWAGIVPDGVSRVSWTFACPRDPARPRRSCAGGSPQTVSVAVRGNVAATTLPGDTGQCGACLAPTSVTWYGPDGHAVGSFGSRTFNLTAPPFVANGRAVIRSSHAGAGSRVRDLLRGDGIGSVRFGATSTATVKALTALTGLGASAVPTTAECGVDAVRRWRTRAGGLVAAAFDHGRFVGYQVYGSAGRQRPRSLGAGWATARGLAPGDTLARGRQLYGPAFVISAAQDGSWSVATASGRIRGYSWLFPDKPPLDRANLVASIAAGTVGCPAASP